MSFENPIEHDFRAETASELLLLTRIEELKRELYRRGFGPICPSPLDEIGPLQSPPPLRLDLASYGEVTDETTEARWRIEARTYGPQSFGQAIYITQRELLNLPPNREADLLAHHFRACLEALGRKARTMWAA